jgi:hypothetical protein
MPDPDAHYQPGPLTAVYITSHLGEVHLRRPYIVRTLCDVYIQNGWVEGATTESGVQATCVP